MLLRSVTRYWTMAGHGVLIYVLPCYLFCTNLYSVTSQGYEVSRIRETLIKSTQACAGKRLVGIDDLTEANTGLIGGLSERVMYWIHGVVHFSPWVYHIGCFSEDMKDEPTFMSTTVPKKDIYHCSKYCRERLSTNFGLKPNECYCFQRQPRSGALTHDKCNSRCDSLHKESCGGRNAIAVYGMIDKLPHFEGQATKQCIILTRIDPSIVIPFDRLCHSDIDGYLCDVTATTLGTEKCVDNVCAEHGTGTWEEAKAKCRNSSASGYLASTFTDHWTRTRLLSLIQDHAEYWSGVFRTFVIDKDKQAPAVSDGCLTVLKTHNRLYFQAQNCFEYELSICRTNASSNTRTERNFASTRSTTLPYTSTMGELSEGKYTKEEEDNLGLIIGLVSGGILCVVVGVVVGVTMTYVLKYKRPSANRPAAVKRHSTETASQQGCRGAGGAMPSRTSGYDSCTVKWAADVEYAYVDGEGCKALHTYTDTSKNNGSQLPMVHNFNTSADSGYVEVLRQETTVSKPDYFYITPVSGQNTDSYTDLRPPQHNTEHQYTRLQT